LARTASRLAGRRSGHGLAGRFGEAAEGRLGQADLVDADQTIVGQQQRRQHDF
jgi:hypothetical protein